MLGCNTATSTKTIGDGSVYRATASPDESAGSGSSPASIARLVIANKSNEPKIEDVDLNNELEREVLAEMDKEASAFNDAVELEVLAELEAESDVDLNAEIEAEVISELAVDKDIDLNAEIEAEVMSELASDEDVDLNTAIEAEVMAELKAEKGAGNEN